MIGIIDIGISNLGSIKRVIEKSGGASSVINSADQIKKYDKLISPGVGHFKSGMLALEKSDLKEALIRSIKADKVPILGICLGMHLMCKRSDEGNSKGLGLIDAEVKKFITNSDYKVPHMGWNIVIPEKNNRLIPISDIEYRYYFVHSYRVVPNNQKIVSGVTFHGENFALLSR